MDLQCGEGRMQRRKSRPLIEVVAPTGAHAPRAPLSAPANRAAGPDIIPFTRPRAISSLPVQFAPAGAVGHEAPSRPGTHPHVKPKAAPVGPAPAVGSAP